MTVAAIPYEEADTLTADRVIEILNNKLSSELDSLYGRGSNDLTNEGLYLPDPDRYYREPAPDLDRITELETFAIFSGERADPNYNEWRNASSGHRVVRASVPWTVSFFFQRELGHDSVSDPVQSRDLDSREIVNRRAKRYRKGIGYTIEKWGMVGSGGATRANAIQDVELGTDFSQTLPFSVRTESSAELMGGGFVEFDIDQWQKTPEPQQT